MTSTLALSTMYFQRWVDQRDLGPFFELGREMGFDRFELSHVLAPQTVAAVDPGSVRIAAAHHPCPAAGAQAGNLVSACRNARRLAAEALSRTLETAERLEAPAVVVHLGALEDDADETCRRLRFEVENRYRAMQRGTERYTEALGALRHHVSSRESATVPRCIDTLGPLVRQATARGTVIALETGYHAHELPRPAGMRALLDALAPDGLGAWLDTGHVGAGANLGLDGFDDWFDAVGTRWTGVHVHDVLGLRDHLIPGMGTLDFTEITRRLPPRVIVSCEFDWYFEPAEVSAGARRITEVMPTLSQAREGPDLEP